MRALTQFLYVATALAALESRMAYPERRVFCPGSAQFGTRRFRCWKHGSRPDPEGLWSLVAFSRPCLVTLLIIVYVLVLEPLGFIIATFALGALLMYVTENRTFVSMVIFPAVLSLAVYTVFYKLLIVPLPEGLFYF